MPLSEMDQVLVDRCLRHAEGAWPDFVDRFLSLFFHVVRHTAQMRSMTLSEADMEDVVAEILLEIAKNDFAVLRQFRGESSLPAYLVVVGRRFCVRKLIKLKREAALGHVHVHRAALGLSSAEIEPLLALDEVDKLMGMLEEKQAEVVRLYHVEFQNYRDIATKVGIEESSVSMILSRARRRLQAAAGQSEKTE